VPDEILGGTMTLAQELKRMTAGTTAPRHPHLVGPLCPPAAMHLTAWWSDVAGTRQNGMGANPITWQELEAWARLTRRRVAPWEAEAIIAGDRAFLRAAQGDDNDDYHPDRAIAAALHDFGARPRLQLLR
jgi:hypothetical protein